MSGKTPGSDDKKTNPTLHGPPETPLAPHKMYEDMGGRPEALSATNNDFCARGPSSIYANAFAPSLISDNSMYSCAAYEPAYIGAGSGVEPLCGACGGCNMQWDLSAWNRYAVAPAYVCQNRSPYAPAQIQTNPLTTMSGAPLDARYAYGQTLALKSNLETALKTEVSKPTVDAAKVKSLANQLQAFQNTADTYGTVISTSTLAAPEEYGLCFGNSCQN